MDDRSCALCGELITEGDLTDHVRAKHAEQPPGMRGIPAAEEYERYAAKVEGREPVGNFRSIDGMAAINDYNNARDGKS